VRKPQTLRNALMAAVPSLAANPDLFWMEISEGQIHARNLGAPTGFEWAYTLEIVIVDTVEEPALIALAINTWAARNQPDLLTAPGILFEAPRVDSEKVDLVFRLRLREVVALVDDGTGTGTQAIQYQDEPDMADLFDAAFPAIPGTVLKSDTSTGTGRSGMVRPRHG